MKPLLLLRLLLPGGSFVADKTQSNSTNRVDWYGNSSGYAFIHAALNVPNTNDWYLI